MPGRSSATLNQLAAQVLLLLVYRESRLNGRERVLECDFDVFSRPIFASAFLFCSFETLIHGGVYKIYSNPRPRQMPRCTFAPPAQATRNQEARNAPCAAQWCCTTGRWSLLPLPLAHTTIRAVAPFQRLTRSGFEFQAHFVPEYPLLQLLGCLDAMYRLDIRTGCSNTDFGRNIKRWSHSEPAFPSTSRRHFGGRGETFFSTLEIFSEL